jgi:hypothetical protein
MITGSVIVGRADRGLMVGKPAPPMLKAIVFRPGLALESRIAWRSEPGPLSAVFVTVKTDKSHRVSSTSKVGWESLHRP